MNQFGHNIFINVYVSILWYLLVWNIEQMMKYTLFIPRRKLKCERREKRRMTWLRDLGGASFNVVQLWEKSDGHWYHQNTYDCKIELLQTEGSSMPFSFHFYRCLHWNCFSMEFWFEFRIFIDQINLNRSYVNIKHFVGQKRV